MDGNSKRQNVKGSVTGKSSVAVRENLSARNASSLFLGFDVFVDLAATVR